MSFNINARTCTTHVTFDTRVMYTAAGPVGSVNKPVQIDGAETETHHFIGSETGTETKRKN